MPQVSDFSWNFFIFGFLMNFFFIFVMFHWFVNFFVCFQKKFFLKIYLLSF